MDAEAILNLPKHHRRTFVSLLVLFCVVLVLCDIFLVPQYFRSYTSVYVQATSGAIISALIIFWILASFVPYEQRSEGLRCIDANKITVEFDDLLKDAQRWRYKGNFGRYLRGKVLPTLAVKPNVHISVSIIDPRNSDLCTEHAEYRNSINAIDKGKKHDSIAVSLEGVVTIICCAWYVANKNISVDLYLSSVFDPIRIDSNDKAMVLTVEDRRSPALRLNSEHYMYKHFELQMDCTRKQAEKISLCGFAKRSTIAAIEEADVEGFLKGINMHELCERLDSGKIVAACREARNPYED